VSTLTVPTAEKLTFFLGREHNVKRKNTSAALVKLVSFSYTVISVNTNHMFAFSGENNILYSRGVAEPEPPGASSFWWNLSHSSGSCFTSSCYDSIVHHGKKIKNKNKKNVAFKTI
jgi:hypothetical protein